MPGLDSDTLLLLHLNGADAATSTTDSSDSGRTVTFVNQAQLDTGVTKFGSATLLLDGTGDRIHVPDHADWDNLVKTTGAFTMDLWVKHTDHAGTETYLSQYQDASNQWYFEHIHGTGIRFLCQDSSSVIINFSGGEITDTSWHHVAVIRVNDDWAIYKDGTQVASALNENHTSNQASTLDIGDTSAGTTSFYGSLDEIRVQNSNYFNADPTNGSDTITVPSVEYSRGPAIRGGVNVGSNPAIY